MAGVGDQGRALLEQLKSECAAPEGSICPAYNTAAVTALAREATCLFERNLALIQQAGDRPLEALALVGMRLHHAGAQRAKRVALVYL